MKMKSNRLSFNRFLVETGSLIARLMIYLNWGELQGRWLGSWGWGWGGGLQKVLQQKVERTEARKGTVGMGQTPHSFIISAQNILASAPAQRIHLDSSSLLNPDWWLPSEGLRSATVTLCSLSKRSCFAQFLDALASLVLVVRVTDNFFVRYLIY